MYIPSYQIHNILKDFTLQLKKWRQRSATAADREDIRPGPISGPNGLRLASVVNKVADNIMERIANLGKETGTTEKAEAKQSLREPNEDSKNEPAAFDYYLLDPKRGKVKQRLVVRDSRQLVQRFQALTAADEKIVGTHDVMHDGP
jgi:hypothetical protein